MVGRALVLQAVYPNSSPSILYSSPSLTSEGNPGQSQGENLNIVGINQKQEI